VYGQWIARWCQIASEKRLLQGTAEGGAHESSKGRFTGDAGSNISLFVLAQIDDHKRGRLAALWLLQCDDVLVVISADF